jgi:hypothetical protein
MVLASLRHLAAADPAVQAQAQARLPHRASPAYLFGPIHLIQR